MATTANDRVLVEIVTAANLAGVEAAKASFLGMNPATLALAASLGILLVVGRAAIDNSKKQETASNDLAQAYGTQKDSLEAHRAELENFLNTNKRFIADSYDTQEALANIVRSGLNPEAQAFRVLNDALDLAVIKHESVSEAAHTLTLAEAGNSKGLRDLGITTAEYNQIMKSSQTEAQKYAALLDLVEKRTAKGRDTTDKLTGSQQALNTDWQHFTVDVAPAVTAAMKDIFDAADTLVQIIDLLAIGLEKVNRNGAVIALLTGQKGAGKGGDLWGLLTGQPGSLRGASGNMGGGIGAAGSLAGPTADQVANDLADRLSFTSGR